MGFCWGRNSWLTATHGFQCGMGVKHTVGCSQSNNSSGEKCNWLILWLQSSQLSSVICWGALNLVKFTAQYFSITSQSSCFGAHLLLPEGYWLFLPAMAGDCYPPKSCVAKKMDSRNPPGTSGTSTLTCFPSILNVYPLVICYSLTVCHWTWPIEIYSWFTWKNLVIFQFANCYPLVNKQFAIENGPIEIVDLSIKNGGFSHSHVNVYQRTNAHLRVHPLRPAPPHRRPWRRWARTPTKTWCCPAMNSWWSYWSSRDMQRPVYGGIYIYVYIYMCV
jgi:hypothetical protein